MLTLLAALALAAAPSPTRIQGQRPPLAVCPTIYIPPVVVTLKNEREQVLGLGSPPPRRPPEDNGLRVTQERTGRYTVSVQRQWYRPVTLHHVEVKENKCGPVKPTLLTIRLTPVPNAPTLRRFVLLGPRDLRVGSWPFYQRYTAFVDAPAGQREVVWSSSNPDVATVDQTGMLRSVCSREGGWTTVTATLKTDPTRQASLRFGTGGSGMVCPRGKVDR